jgi:hypothetical protein
VKTRLFVWYCSCGTACLTTGTVHLAAGSLPRVVTMPDDTEAAALRAQLETIVKEAEDAKAQATAARRRVQAARLLLEEEESKPAPSGAELALRVRGLHHSALLAISELPQSSGRSATGGDSHG